LPGSSIFEAMQRRLSQQWRERRLAIAITLGATIVFFHRAIFTSGIFAARDMLRVYYPLRQYWAERVSHLEFPFWYPYDGLGQPFLGMVISGALHPTNLLYLVLPIAAAVKVNVLICFPAAFGGIYCLLRRFDLPRSTSSLGGLLFAFNGYMVTISGNLLYLMAAASIPWVLWAADRFFARPTPGAALLAASLLSSVLFCGDAQSFAVCAVACGVLAAIRHHPEKKKKTAATLSALWALAGLLAAVQILPALSAMSQGQAGHQSLDVALVWSMHPLRLAEVVFGPIFADGNRAVAAKVLQTSMNSLWADSVYVGLVAVALAGIAAVCHRNRRSAILLVFSAATTVALLLGKHLGAYALLFKVIPLWRPFRFPEKLTPYLMLLIACGAAVGLQSVLQPSRRRAGALVFGALSLACAGLFSLEQGLGVFSRHALSGVDLGGGAADATRGFHRGLLAAFGQTAAFMLLTAFLFLRVRDAGLLRWLLCGVIFISLYLANEPLYELANPEVLTPNAFAAEIKRRDGPPRLGGFRVASGIADYHPPALSNVPPADAAAITTSTAFAPTTPAIWNFESINVYLPAFSARIHELLSHGSIWYRRYMRLFSAKYLSVPTDLYQRLGGTPEGIIAQQPQLGLLLVQNPNVRPRAYLARVRCVSRADSLALMHSTGFAWDREALVECNGVPITTADDAALGTAEIISYAPERLEVDARVNAASVLVLTDSYYQGWSAWVDGKQTDLLPTNYAVRGLLLTPGRHSIVLEYRCPGFLPGLGLGAFAVAACAVVALWRTRVSKSIASAMEPNRLT
jgi:hypothetical protein